MPLDSTQPLLSHHERETLLDVAATSIRTGLATGRKLDVDVRRYPQPLCEVRATFVTLRIAGRLRGCMGALAAAQPLVADVAHNAFAAAFRDPRFPALEPAEADQLDIHISVLSQPFPITFVSQEELLAKIRPGIDGLILIEGPRRGTLLPSVWESLDDPRTFFEHLKQKAGLPADYWSDTLRVERYTTVSFGRE